MMIVDQSTGSEEDIIRAFFRPLASGCDAALDLKDDAGCFEPAPGMDLVITTDALVETVHFRANEDPEKIGYKAGAVNVSDLVAKGADPVAYLLSLALPKPEDGSPGKEVTENWLRGFASGLGCWVQGKLLGGDLVATPGPLTLSITAIGEVPKGRMVRRTTAAPGDIVYVTGVIGGSMLGLQILNGHERHPFPNEARAILISDYHYPMPPIGLTGVIREYATAAMDLSDGLVRDAMRMCDGSGVGMEINGPTVPLRQCVRDRINEGHLDLGFPLTAGDDYQVLMTVAAEKANAFEQAVRDTGDIPVTSIGIVTSKGRELIVQDVKGQRMVFGDTGHDHFRAQSK